MDLFPKFSDAGLLGAFPDGNNDDRLPELAVERGGSITGTPEDAIEGIECIIEESGASAVSAAPCSAWSSATPCYAATSSAGHVIPHFQGQSATMKANRERVLQRVSALISVAVQGRDASATVRHPVTEPAG